MEIYYTLEGLDSITGDWLQYDGTHETLATAKRLKKDAQKKNSTLRISPHGYKRWRIIKYVKIKTVLK